MRDFGLLEDIREFTAYVLGGSQVPYVPYQPDGDWTPYLPKYESQSTRFETHGCTVWGLQNQVETLFKRLYKDEPNYSERFTYLLAGVVPGRGADPQVVYESVRKNGLIDQSLLPMTDTLEDFIDKSDITGSLLAKGQNWLEKHDFKHEWLWTRRPENWKEILREALQTSPIGVSVTAWMQVNGLYVSDSGGNNHWCLLYKIDDDGVMWVFDTYDHSQKPLHPEHNIRRAKRIWINRKTRPAMKKHVGILQTIVERLTMRKSFLDVCTEALGTDVTPDDLVPDAVACAITVTTLLSKVDATFPRVAGTWTLYDILKHRKDYERVTVPSPGTIIISPTGLGAPGTNGHVGVFLRDGMIASNDSKTGKFVVNHTLDSWHRYYSEKLQYPIFMFTKK
jgi:hypothetical protein